MMWDLEVAAAIHGDTPGAAVSTQNPRRAHSQRRQQRYRIFGIIGDVDVAARVDRHSLGVSEWDGLQYGQSSAEMS